MQTKKSILGYDKFLLMALLKEGPLQVQELDDKTVLFLSLIWYQQLPEKNQPLLERLFFTLSRLRSELENRRSDKKIGNTGEECEKLVENGFLKLNKDNAYELTPDGEKQATLYVQNMEEKASQVQKRVIKPSAAAINTTFLDFFLAIMKLGAGLYSGSVGLIADGTDATMDTVSAFLVWLGIKYHRENLSTFLVIFGLFFASLSIGYDSISHILRALNGTLEPVTMPYLVIAVEAIAILAAFFLFYYQRYVGKVSSSLTLISQSVDSKNHIFIGLSVIAGAIFALNGIYFVDALIGFFIALGIFKDASDLLREAISKGKGGAEDYSNYKLPLQECWENNKTMAFQNWILYILWSEERKNRSEIVASLKKSFDPENYIPVLYELKATCSEEYDFESNIENLINPLKEYKLLIQEDEYYILTDDGKNYLNEFMSNFDYYDVHMSDTILLSMAEDMY
jgi:Co/Zn/Cd efflux system component